MDALGHQPKVVKEKHMSGTPWSSWSRATKIFVSVGIALAAVLVAVLNFT